jgi:hypothetical protein
MNLLVNSELNSVILVSVYMGLAVTRALHGGTEISVFYGSMTQAQESQYTLPYKNKLNI